MKHPVQLLSSPWAMSEEAFRRICALWPAVEEKPKDFLFFFEDDAAPEEETFELRGDVAVIRVSGPLSAESDVFSRMFGGTTYQGIEQSFRDALDDGDVKRIALEINSPGGEAISLAKVSDLIHGARDHGKHIEAIITGEGASAAYFIASAAHGVTVARDALVGSIGTRFRWIDTTQADKRRGVERIEILSSQSPNKTLDPTTERGRVQAQMLVDQLAGVFVAAVARNRKTTEEIVLRDFGAGGVLVGQHAVDAGLADQIGTLEEFIVEGPGELNSSVQVPAISGRLEGAMAVIEISQITESWLQENLPNVVASLRRAGEKTGHEAGLTEGTEKGLTDGRAEGAKSERERILALDALSAPGHEEIIREAKADPNVTAGDTAIKLNAAQKAKRDASLEALKADEKKLDKPKPSSGDGGESAADLAAQIVNTAVKAGAISAPAGRG